MLSTLLSILIVVAMLNYWGLLRRTTVGTAPKVQRIASRSTSSNVDNDVNKEFMRNKASSLQPPPDQRTGTSTGPSDGSYGTNQAGLYGPEGHPEFLGTSHGKPSWNYRGLPEPPKDPMGPPRSPSVGPHDNGNYKAIPWSWSTLPDNPSLTSPVPYGTNFGATSADIGANVGLGVAPGAATEASSVYGLQLPSSAYGDVGGNSGMTPQQGRIAPLAPPPYQDQVSPMGYYGSYEFVSYPPSYPPPSYPPPSNPDQGH